MDQTSFSRFTDLNDDEVSDLWLTAQAVGAVMEQKHCGQALTLAMQDGTAAGQTVNHVHVHVLPRQPGDFKRNEEVYERLDEHDANRQAVKALLDDEARKPRTRQEMNEEAKEIRSFIERLVAEQSK